MKATPRPWTNSEHEDRLLRGANGEQVIFSGRGFALACGVPSEQSRVDAEFVIEAVNEYDRLRVRIAELESERDQWKFNYENEAEFIKSRAVVEGELVARIAELEEALRPFAAFNKDLRPDVKTRGACLEASDIRRAARALKDTDT